MIDQELFPYYRRLKNHLRRTLLSDSLYVLWSYMQHLQFNREFNRDIEVAWLYESKDLLGKNRIIPPWKVEVLVKEAILYSSEKISSETLKKWNYMALGANKVRSLESKIAKVYVHRSNILREISRMTYRQFVWYQNRPNIAQIIKYYKIFGSPQIAQIIKNKTGLNLKKIYLLGMVLIGNYLKSPALDYPPKIENVDIDDLNKFLNHFCVDLETMKDCLKSNLEINEKYHYAFNPLREHPLIRMNYFEKDSLVCPIPTFLFWRFTSGIYYEIYNEKGFGNLFGNSFQKYVGEVLEKGAPKQKLIKEKKYKIKKKASEENTSDWLLLDKNSILFIECKAKRIAEGAKSELLEEKEIDQQLEYAAKFIVQVYKTIKDYLNGYYSKEIPLIKNNIFPLIVTLEEWYLYGDYMFSKLDKIVKDKMETADLPMEWLEVMPYSMCSVDHFEDVVQIINQVGIEHFMKNKVFDKEKRTWLFDSYMRNNFPEIMEKNVNLFADEATEFIKGYMK